YTRGVMVPLGHHHEERWGKDRGEPVRAEHEVPTKVGGSLPGHVLPQVDELVVASDALELATLRGVHEDPPGEVSLRAGERHEVPVEERDRGALAVDHVREAA